jgi:hypothetical protein
VNGAALAFRVAYASLTLLALCGGCRVGDPLVDQKEPRPPGGINIAACKRPELESEHASCETEADIAISRSAAKPLHWQICNVMCGTGQPDVETDDVGQGGALAAPIACLPTESFDAAPSARLMCTSKRFAVEPLPTTATHAMNTVTGARWQSSNIVLEADAPAELTISGSELSDVRLHLIGPVTVRFQDATTLVRVSISSASPDARVALDEVDPEDLTIGDSDQPFAGHVAARHSEIVEASWVIESGELDSASISEAFVDARDLVSNDGLLFDVTLALGHALFAPTAMEVVDIESCQSLSIFGSELGHVAIPSCSDEPTRIYASKLTGGSLDGAVHGDSSKLDQVRLGQKEPSDLVLWAVSVTSSVFCDELESLKVSPSSVQCSSCTERALDPRDKGCLLPDDTFELIEDLGRQNFCEELDTLERCPAPLPVRSRPFVDGL